MFTGPVIVDFTGRPMVSSAVCNRRYCWRVCMAATEGGQYWGSKETVCAHLLRTTAVDVLAVERQVHARGVLINELPANLQ